MLIVRCMSYDLKRPLPARTPFPTVHSRSGRRVPQQEKNNGAYKEENRSYRGPATLSPQVIDQSPNGDWR